jgi:hypothetical protein
VAFSETAEICSLQFLHFRHPWRSENDRFVGNESGRAQRARGAPARDGRRQERGFRFSLGTSLCLAAARRPAAVQIGSPADLSSFRKRVRDCGMPHFPVREHNDDVIQSVPAG